MRSITATLRKKLAARVQAGENSLSASFWVARLVTPLTEDRFLEKQTVLSSEGITKTSIAVCHPRLMRGATDVYIGYLKSGVIKIAKADYVEEMSKHKWTTDIGYSQEATDFCLCFDGTMSKAPDGMTELITEELPWVFWVLNGKLYANKLWSNSVPVVLAEANCTKVTAARATWSYSGGFDFGLVVFFLLEGQLYYRQLQEGKGWADAEAVSFGPEGVLWSEIAAFRTWDHRIGVQCKAQDGTCYEMFTQFMGIAKQNTEHIEIKDVKATSELAAIDFTNAKEDEHIEITSITAGAPYGGLYSTAQPIILSAENIEDADENWGTTVVVTFNVHMLASSMTENLAKFSLVDSLGVKFNASQAVTSDGKTFTIKLGDFNSARGECQFCYTPGTLKSAANTQAEALSFSFTPTNLDAPQIPVPEVNSIWNI